MSTERIYELDDTRHLKRNDESLYLAILVSLNSKAAVLKRAMSKRSAGWSSRDWHSKANWQRSPIEDGGQSSQDKWKNLKPRVQWKEMSHNVDELGTLVNEKKSTWVKSCKESSKRETAVDAISEGMAEDAKVDDGIRNRINKGLKQLHKARKCRKMMKMRRIWLCNWKSICGRSSMNTCIRGNKKAEDQTTSARRSGNDLK